MLSERVGDAAHGLLGDVLVERAGRGARGEDALDGVVVEGAEGGGVAQGRVEVGRGEALAQLEDSAGLVSPDRGAPALMRRKKRAACSPMRSKATWS